MKRENVENLEKFKREKRRKDFQRNLTKFITVSEKALYRGKKLMIVVIIPALEVLANLLTLIDENNRDDYQ